MTEAVAESESTPVEVACVLGADFAELSPSRVRTGS
jgi:hypothetical protein